MVGLERLSHLDRPGGERTDSQREKASDVARTFHSSFFNSVFTRSALSGR